MILELYTMPKAHSELAIKLGLVLPKGIEIDVLVVRVDFTVSAFRASTFYQPAEGGELEVKVLKVLHLLPTESDIPVELTDEQKVIAAEYIDHDLFESHLYDAYDCNQAEGYDVY